MQKRMHIDFKAGIAYLLKARPYEKYFKRVIDIILSALTFFLLLPIILTIAVCIKIVLGSPILHKTKRAGKNEKPFILYKFRSMLIIKDTEGKLLPDEMRLTKLGQILRSTSLDELPELINIVKGDMSIVGPRPLPLSYLPYYNDIEKLRHRVRPGLTGLAQINGRNKLSWEQKFTYDLEYINKITFIGDLKIILKTIIRVFDRSEIRQVGVDIPENFHEYRIRQMEERTFHHGVN